MWGVVSSRIQAYRIVDHLTNAGFDRDEVSVLFPDGNEDLNHALASHETAANVKGMTVRIGLVVGGALGWLAGLNAFSIPGYGHLIAGGPVGVILTGAVTGSIAREGIHRTFVEWGIRRNEAELYLSKVKNGQILVCLQAKRWREADAARRIFQAMDASNITISGAKVSGLLHRALSRVAGRGRNPDPAVEIAAS